MTDVALAKVKFHMKGTYNTIQEENEWISNILAGVANNTRGSINCLLFSGLMIKMYVEDIFRLIH